MAGVSLATLAGAWAFQFAGYEPCPLCLEERIPYYAAAIGGLLAALIARPAPKVAALLLGALALAFLYDAGLSVYHAGAEWHFWPGPKTCSGSFSSPQTSPTRSGITGPSVATKQRCAFSGYRLPDTTSLLRERSQRLAAWPPGALCEAVHSGSLYGVCPQRRRPIRDRNKLQADNFLRSRLVLRPAGMTRFRQAAGCGAAGAAV